MLCPPCEIISFLFFLRPKTHVQQEVVQVEVGVPLVPSKLRHLRSVEYYAPANLPRGESTQAGGVLGGYASSRRCRTIRTKVLISTGVNVAAYHNGMFGSSSVYKNI